MKKSDKFALEAVSALNLIPIPMVNMPSLSATATFGIKIFSKKSFGKVLSIYLNITAGDPSDEQIAAHLLKEISKPATAKVERFAKNNKAWIRVTIAGVQ